ncbi:NAD(P)-dependent oxidoreductase [Paenibacillus piri]|uniref:NAD(P)-dependent oxidoreductase n=1 Tax=Paenibacillus piri TaxID=2547395 RepID=UPI001404A743|nr:NAD(P)-dependent oxidoreductase [Paenibacillus piri]
MSKFKVVLTGPSWPSALEKIELQCEVRIWKDTEPIPRALLLEWLQDAEGLFSTGDVKVDCELLAAAPQLRVVAQSSVGYDNIDIDACTARGVPFGNTPGVLVEATADLTFALLLTSARRIHEGWDNVRSGGWKSGQAIPYGVDLFGKTLGIVGMGDIGCAVARRAKACGLNIIYHNRTKRKDGELLEAAYADFTELLQQSDFIISLVPLSQQSRGIFGAEQFRLMKPTAYFINASRGGKDLLQALRIGNHEESAALFEQFVSAFKQQADIETVLRQGLLQLLGSVLHVVYQTGHSPQKVFGLSNLYEELLQHHELQKMCDCFIHLVMEPFIELIVESQNVKLVQLVEEVKETIHSKYNIDLSLEMCADLHHVDPFRLSKAFKEVTGINFIDYVTDYRIKKSKDLLKNTSLRINEIAELVGYQPTYFNRIFKKRESMTPGQYRER